MDTGLRTLDQSRPSTFLVEENAIIHNVIGFISYQSQGKNLEVQTPILVLFPFTLESLPKVLN